VNCNVTAKPVQTTLGSVEEAAGAATQPGLSTGRELHWHLGQAVWPTKASGQAGDDRMEKLLLTVREAAEVLSVSRSQEYELIYAEQLDSVKIGRSRRVSLASVQRLADGLPAA
jgi:excisionase family DNA binding protein